MGKKVEKALRGGAPLSATSRGDDSSTPEPYTCTGNFADDFSELWQRTGLIKEHLPVIRSRGKRPSTPVADESKASPEDEVSEVADENAPPTTYTVIDNLSIYRPSIQVEYDPEETKQATIYHAREIFIRSWKIEEKVISVLKQCGLDRLQCINFWNAGLTEHAIKSLAVFLPQLPCLKTLVLDGNPIPTTEPYHLLIGDYPLQHLSLRNNKITDKGVELLSMCIGQTRSQNRYLTTLNLSFNHIGDKGAGHLAQALRMNRVLLSLSLASNEISDVGCRALTTVLKRFDLTHEEVVQRRKLMSRQGYDGRGTSAPGSRRADSKDRPSSNRSGSVMTSRANRGSSKKKDTPKKGDASEKTPKKDDRGKKGELTKMTSKLSIANETPKGTKGKKSGGAGGKDGGKRGTGASTTADNDTGDLPEFMHPLLDPQAEHTEGKVFVPGCVTLINLNLSRNRIGVSGMESMLNVVKYQVNRRRLLADTPAGPGLFKISLQKNQVPEDHPTYFAIQEAMLSRDPMYKPEAKSPDEDLQSIPA